MKLKKIHIEKYKVFRDFDLELTHDGEPLGLVVIAGINGSGKTTLFEFIYGFIKQKKYRFDEKSYIICEVINTETGKPELTTFKRFTDFEIEFDIETELIIPDYEGDIVYIKTYEINETNASASIIKYIDKLIYEKDIKSSLAYQKVNDILYRIFNGFDLQVEFNTLDKNRNVYFKNELNEYISITELSSGEKELITKAFSLYLTDVKDSVILIDEPETSLHPNWQNKIVKVYEDFAKENNNQIFIATHSPHIIASAKKESLRLLVKKGDKIEVVSDFDGSYGYEVDRVLRDIMDIESLRNFEIDQKLSRFKELVISNEFDTEEFIHLEKELNELLGRNDKDLILLRLEIAKRKKLNEKN